MAKKRANKNRQRALGGLVLLWFIGTLAWYLHAKNFAVLNPAGQVANKERNLMLVTLGLGLLVLIPVFVMTALISVKYREGAGGKYSPELRGNRRVEAVWWAIPILIIGLLGVLTWNSSHALDPRKALAGSAAPLDIQVVALDWKWLFIYPEQGVASVNQVELPVGRPVNFEITSDAPMNSFWIPQLGGQIYAMPGMRTNLNLIANKTGTYHGSSANISGEGFAGMRFTAVAVPGGQFNGWLQRAKHSGGKLSLGAYNQLAQPSQSNPVKTYSSVDPGLFNHVLLKYMAPGVN